LPSTPDTIITEVSQLFYFIAWPHGGAPSDLISSVKASWSQYSDSADKIAVFDKYQGISPKDREQMRHTGEGTIDYELSITSSLLKRDAILKSKTNKQRLSSVLSTFSLKENVTMETRDEMVHLVMSNYKSTLTFYIFSSQGEKHSH